VAKSSPISASCYSPSGQQAYSPNVGEEEFCEVPLGSCVVHRRFIVACYMLVRGRAIPLGTPTRGGCCLAPFELLCARPLAIVVPWERHNPK
jgi:hypothetical protein